MENTNNRLPSVSYLVERILEISPGQVQFHKTCLFFLILYA